MVHQAHKVLPEPGDYRPTSWRDVVGLLMALIGLALLRPRFGAKRPNAPRR